MYLEKNNNNDWIDQTPLFFLLIIVITDNIYNLYFR